MGCLCDFKKIVDKYYCTRGVNRVIDTIHMNSLTLRLGGGKKNCLNQLLFNLIFFISQI